MPKLRKQKFAHLAAVRRYGWKHLQRRPYFIPLIGLVLGLMIVGGALAARGGHPPRPSDSHIVFLFDNGEQQTLDTKAKTVGDLLGRLPLHLIPQDVVEPARGTPIPEDNFRINIYRARPVTIVDDHQRQVVVTAQRSPRVAATDAGIKVYPEDLVNFGQGDVRQNILGEKIVIDRATPVKFNLYGSELLVHTRTQTVADLLKEKNVKLAKNDTLKPAADTPIKPGMKVEVIRNGVKITTIEEDIAPPTQLVYDSSLSFGTRVVRQAGTPGKKAVTYQVTTKNGKVTRKVLIQQAVVQKPVPKIIAQGTTVSIYGDRNTWMAQAGISSSDFAYVNFIISRESNWNPLASNPSGAYGLCQALPGSKMATSGSDWQSNPVTQLRWCSGYADGRYGSWAGAYNFWLANNYW